MVLNKTNPELFDIIIPILKKGGTAVLPCDTIYGLCALYKIGEKSLQKIKKRYEKKRFLILATIEQVNGLSENIPEDILSCWPGPLTVILNFKDGTKQAVRVPDDCFLQKLLNELGSPLYSTSVNLSGEPELLDFTSICQKFEKLTNVIIRGQEIQGTVPSTIIDATCKPYKLIRQGSFNVSDLLNHTVIE